MTPIEFLAHRRTIPAGLLAAPGPNEEQLRTILTVATRVPDHGKLAPWRFILWEGDARAAANAALLALRRSRAPEPTPADIEAETTRFTRAPLVVGLVSRVSQNPKATAWEQELSAGAVGMNLINAANALGFGTQWLTDWPAYDAAAAALFGLAPGERFAGFIHVGTPTAPPQERWRPEVAPLVTRWSPPR